MARAWLSWLAETWFAERERWVLWLPVAFGGGIAGYFALRTEPPPHVGAIFALLILAALLRWRRRPAALLVLTPLLAFALGFAAAQARSAWVAAPLLVDRLGPATVEGLLEAVDVDGKAYRLLLRPTAIEGLTEAELPRRVRIRTAKALPPEILPGSHVRVLATLLPPPAPTSPGDYDFGREAWFRGLGAVGYTLGKVELLAGAEEGSWRLWWSALRHVLSVRILAVLPDDRGTVANALLTGEQGAISEPMIQAYRDSGLAHLLSISGLHVGLIAGIFFFILRGGLALIPAIALRYPIKKWAALVAALVLPFYMWFVGSAIPVQRSCLMVLIVLLAVLLDRRAISLRLVAWAAVAVLLLAPEALLSASFQMSFGAVTALIAAYEWWGRESGERGERSWPARVAFYALGVLASSLIASLATAPFAAFHFDRLSLYGLAANMVAVPLTAFWIMPWCLLVYLLFPFGLEAWALQPLGWGVEAVNRLAEGVAAWPGASLLVPAMPLWGLVLATLGGLWLCLWSRRWRWAGLVALLLGAASPALVRPPDLLVAGDAKVVGLADPEGQLWLSTRRAGRFLSDAWLERRAQRAAAVWPRDGDATAGWLSCDSLGCLYRHNGQSVALVLQAAALDEDCRGVDAVVSLVPARERCAGEGPVIDRFDLWRDGTYALWLDEREIVVLSVAAARGERPWNPRRSGGQAVALPP